MSLPNKKDAQKILSEYVTNPYQFLHAQMVANALEAYAENFEEDQKLWFLTGLLHDLDYDKFPEEHPQRSIAWFEEWNYPETMIKAIKVHALSPEEFIKQDSSKLSNTLYATDELAGLLHAYSLMRPEGFEGMKAKKVKKKFKDKSFAAKIDREVISTGIEKMNTTFVEHTQFLINVFLKMET